MTDETTSMNTPALFETPLRGIVPPLVTPLLNRDEIDTAGTERLIEHVISGGVSGIFILGTTGEAPSLSYRLRREFIQLVTGLVKGRVPVLVGITDTAFVESIALANHASDCGAAAVVLSTPYYFPAGQTELSRYVEQVIAELPLPLILYNMPSLTKVWFEIETLQELTRHKKIVGVKDSSGDLDYFEQLVGLKTERPDWTIMIGPEALLPEAIGLGGDGGVSGGANVYPELFVECYASIVHGDIGRLERVTAKIERLQDIYSVGKYASRFIKATKCALSLREICSDHMAEPFNHFLQPERDRVAAIIDDVAR